MATLGYVGPAAASSLDLVNEAYIVNTLMASNMTTSQVDSVINSGLSSYATQAYVGSVTATLATQSWINSQVANYAALNTINANNGVPALDASGKIPSSRVNVASTQRWPSLFWSPSAYQSALTTATTETNLFNMSIADPGYAYRPAVTGIMSGGIGTDAGPYPIIRVRVGSITGPIVAQGYGLSEFYPTLNQTTGFTTAYPNDLGPSGWTLTYNNTSTNEHIFTASNEAQWATDRLAGRAVRCQRSGTFDATTGSDYQQIDMLQGQVNNIELAPFTTQSSATNSMIGRMSSDGQNYIRVNLNWNLITVFYALNGSEAVLTGPWTMGYQETTGAKWRFQCGDPAVGPRRFNVLVQSQGSTTWNSALQFDDSSNLSQLGSSYRGWGFGMSGASEKPASIASVSILDPTTGNSGQITIMPVPLSSQSSTLTGAQTLYVNLVSSDGTSTAQVDTTDPGLMVMAVPQ